MTSHLLAPALTAPAAFDLLGPLPTGTTLLEASAGTGKTYTIAALVTRYVAEGTAALDDLLVITFGREAIRELRERVRDRLTGARDALADPEQARAGADALLRHLATGPAAEIEARRRRLTAATADFDAATIATTHSFCQLVLRGLGTVADNDPDTELVSELGELVAEVAADLYLRKYHHYDGVPEVTLELAHAIARAATGDEHAQLAPAPGGSAGSSSGAVRARYAGVVRSELADRLARTRRMGFDALLTRLRGALLDPGTGAGVAAELRRRYRVVLVDEFQDTDPAQWDILHAAFHGRATLVLIGDPKQAIYAFRGGDVHAYLTAAGSADTQATLPKNFRSDECVLAGLAALLGGAELGDARIVVGPVGAGRPEPLLHRPQGGAAVRVRVMRTEDLKDTQTGSPSAPQVRSRVADDLVADIVRVLQDGSTLRPATGGESAPVRPGDIAVLVATHKEGELVRDRLVAAGVPTVVQATASVFGTAAAAEWVALLAAIGAPHRSGPLRRVAVSPFVGMDAAELVAGGESAHDLLAQRVRFWGVTLAERGVCALLSAVDSDYRMLPRLLGQVGGERLATDLRHIGDVLHSAAVTERLGPTALLTWLRRRIAEVELEPTAERSRRLDSDAAAVQVVTIHRSKGLEFPLVYLPFAWSRWKRPVDVALFHDPGTGTRTRHVGGLGSDGWDDAVAWHRAEEAGEDLRRLYVAATRARSQLTVWWARSGNTETAALHRLLFSPPGGAAPATVAVPDDDTALARLRERAADGGGALAIEEAVAATVPATWSAPASPGGTPVAAVFGRGVDTDWKRTSYSSLTAAAHAAGPGVAAEPESEGKTDEPDSGEDGAPGRPLVSAEPAPAPPSPFGALPGGTAFGTLVHAVLEVVEATSADLRAALGPAVDAALRRTPVAGVGADELVEAIAVSMSTPLGPLAGGRALTDIDARDRLAELEFELPLAGGDRPRPESRLGDLARLLELHLDPADPMRAYAGRLASPDLAGAPLRGYLTGSIDAVLRVPGPDGPAYLVVDYKTNVLHPPDVAATAWHYRPDALGPAMRAADYPLQALLYQVALHRYLTWRQPGYDPAAQLGGVLYLYLRGMCGPGTTAPDGGVPGVFAWRPPAALILALSDLLAGNPA